VVVDAERGYIVTNNHVVEGADQIEIGLADGRAMVAELVGRDPHFDLAVLRVESENLQAVTFANSTELRVGDFVVAIGNPFNLKQTVTSGIVSALGRSGLGFDGYEDFIQTDASINPGNSGGALVDLRGHLVGINTAIFAPSGGNVGIGFAIPSNMVFAVMQQLIEHGEVRRGLIGVTIQQLHSELAEAFEVELHSGVLVTRVERDSPADEAGLREEDIILRVGDRDIANPSDFNSQAAVMFIGDTFPVVVLRDGRRRTLNLEISEASQQQLAGRQLHLGLAGIELENFRNPDEPGMSSGVLATEVDPGSLPYTYGLRAGDVIVGANGRTVRDIADLGDALLLENRRIVLQVYRNGDFGNIVIR
jgi:serine protease Do/serine protease DegQ